MSKDTKKTIDDLLLSLPYKKGDLVRTFYTNPPSTKKIEELEISSAASSGVRVKLEGVKTVGGSGLWLDSGWIEPIKPLPFVGEVVNYVGGKEPQQLEVKEVLTDLTPPMIKLAGVEYLVDPDWVSPIKNYPSPSDKQSLQYKAGDKVTFFQNNTPHYPLELVVERIFPTLQGVRVKFVGVDEPGDPKWIFQRIFPTLQGVRVKPYKEDEPGDPKWILPKKEETAPAPAPAPAEKPKAKLNIKWIPIDSENLPEGEVLAIRENLWLIGKIDYYLGHTRVTTDKNTYFYNPEAYIPLSDLKQLWEEQNPVSFTSGYSKESAAFKLLEWVLVTDSYLKKVLEEIPEEAELTIQMLAREIHRQSYNHYDSPPSPSGHDNLYNKFLEELIYWIKDYIAN